VKQTVSALQEVLKLLRKGWTKGANARDKSGEEVPSRAPTAVKWCLNGAILCVGKGKARKYIEEALPKRYQGDSLCVFNDSQRRTKKEVIDVVRKAIQLAKKATKAK
jgi:hypothetical protein